MDEPTPIPDPPEPPAPTPPRRGPLVAAIGLALAVALFLGLRAGDLGLAWDECYYVTWSDQFDAWWALLAERGPGAAFTREAIERGWHYREHPPGAKALGWIGHSLLPAAVPLPLRYRLGGIALFALTVGFAFHRVQRRWGWLAAIGAAGGLLGQPRLLGHASLYATDAPLACLLLLALLAAPEADRERRSLALLWLAVAAAFLTKFTAVLLPAVLVPWALATGRRRLALHVVAASAAGAALMALTYPPWLLWAEFFGLPASFARAPYSVYFLGEWYQGSPPWYWLFVMAAVVPPVGFLLAALGGGAALVRRELRAPDAAARLLLLACLVWTVVFLLPPTPRHDQLRQPLFLFATLGLTGGAGLGLLARGRHPLLAGALVLVPWTGLVTAVRTHPYPLSSYSEAVGGLAGAAGEGGLGMEPTYWLEAITPEVLAHVNRTLPPGATLSEPLSRFYPFFLANHGLLRPDIAPAMEGEYALLINRMSQRGRLRQHAAGRPVDVLREWRHDGVWLVALVRFRPPPR